MPGRILLLTILIGVVFCSALPRRIQLAPRSPRKFDQFSKLPCADELARVENYANELRELGDALAVVVIYAGRSDTKRGEVMARLFAIRDRLTKYGSIEGSRIVLFNGGFREEFEIELWIIPSIGRSSASSLAVPTVEPADAKLKRQAVRTWTYSCAHGQPPLN